MRSSYYEPDSGKELLTTRNFSSTPHLQTQAGPAKENTEHQVYHRYI